MGYRGADDKGGRALERSDLFLSREWMRIKKVTGLTLEWIDDEETASGYYDEHQDTNHPTWRYRYDGQMCMDEDFTTGAGGGSVTGSAYGLGARSIDMIRPFTVSGGTRSYGEAQFPIYDGHGNMKCTLSRSGSSPWYAISNSRSYDVWGGVRDGSSTGDPNTRYCANLGHKQDDESGLIYMRARYYEPGTGRFVSEDPARDGTNWFVYCGNSPIQNIDFGGTTYEAEMNDLMLQFANLMVGIGRTASNAARISEIRVLVAAMEAYVGLERSEAARHFATAQLLAASGSVEGSRTYQALGGKARASAIVGRVYIGQMMLGILGILFEVW